MSNPPQIGFARDVLMMTAVRQNISKSIADFFAEPTRFYPSYATVNTRLVRVVEVGWPVSMLVTETVGVSINGGNPIVCGLDQIFYLLDGSEIAASDLRSGMSLQGVMPNVPGWLNEGSGVLGQYQGWRYDVSGVTQRTWDSPFEIANLQTVTYNQFTLQNGVLVKGIPYVAP